MKDLVSKILVIFSLAIAARTTTSNGTGIDLQGFNSAAIVIAPGTITDGSHTVTLEESDDNSAFTDVAASDLIGGFVPVVSNTTQKVGYKGNKRYIRAVTTIAGATTGGIYGIQAILSNPDLAPVA